jgi:hypothetical protein
MQVNGKNSHYILLNDSSTHLQEGARRITTSSLDFAVSQMRTAL